MAEETNCLLPVTNVFVPDTGSKYVWTHREALIQLQKYTPYFRLIDFVNKIRCKRFYEPADRLGILMSACILMLPAPFYQNRRFPEDYWVNLSVGPVAEAMNCLITSLDIPSPLLLSQINAQDWDTWKKKYDSSLTDI